MKLNKRGKIVVVLGVLILITSISFASVKKVFFNKGKVDIRNYTISADVIDNIRKDPRIPKIEREMIKKKEKELELKNENMNQDKVEKIVYLTIDDGPSKYTDDILDLLNKYNVKATFFMIGNNMEKYPKKVLRLTEEGHSAGFHSISHDKNKLYDKDNPSVVSEFDSCYDIYYDITKDKSSLIRLPYGSKPYLSKESYTKLLEKGYKIWDWNVDSQDWKGDPKAIVETIKKQSTGKNTILFLVHEKPQTVETLEEIIKYFKSENYTFVALRQNDNPLNYWIGIR